MLLRIYGVPRLFAAHGTIRNGRPSISICLQVELHDIGGASRTRKDRHRKVWVCCDLGADDLSEKTERANVIIRKHSEPQWIVQNMIINISERSLLNLRHLPTNMKTETGSSDTRFLVISFLYISDTHHRYSLTSRRCPRI